MKLDIKDKKILYYLLQDSRQSFKKLGKKAGVSSDFVSYRIKRLIKDGIINAFTIRINCAKLGYTTVSVYFKFKNISPKIKNDIINYFVNHKLTRYVSSLEGIYDLQVQIFNGNIHEFESFIDEIKNKFNKYLIGKFVDIWVSGETNRASFLLNESVNINKPISWGGKQIFTSKKNILTQIDTLDFKILSELVEDSRIPTKLLANKLNSSVSIVNYRIQKLIKIGIIQGYTINVDWSKIGYKWFHLRINLYNYDDKYAIIKHIRKNPKLYYILKGIVTNLITEVDIHCTYLLKNVEELRSIIDELTSKFPNLITNYEFYSTYKIYKFHRMIPKVL